MTKYKAIIVDDEQHARIVLMNLLSGKFDFIEVVGEAANLPEAIELINKTDPNIVFLDIEMPKFSGLRIAEFIGKERNFEIIFVTAYDHYAINAFKVSAFDYLLKPVQADDLKVTLERLKERLTYKADLSSKLKALDENMSNGKVKKLVIHTHQGIHYFDLESILYIEASGMYSVIHTFDANFVASKPLKDLEELLDSRFFRAHRSYIVNCENVIKVNNKEALALLKNNHSIPISRTKKEDFLVSIEKYSK